MTIWELIMEPVSTLIVAVFIFGGAFFIFTLLRFWVLTLIENHRRRRRNKAIIDAALHHFSEDRHRRTV